MKKKPYNFQLEEFVTKGDFNTIKKFSDGKETPFLIVDLQKIERIYDELLEYLKQNRLL